MYCCWAELQLSFGVHECSHSSVCQQYRHNMLRWNSRTPWTRRRRVATLRLGRSIQTAGQANLPDTRPACGPRTTPATPVRTRTSDWTCTQCMRPAVGCRPAPAGTLKSRSDDAVVAVKRIHSSGGVELARHIVSIALVRLHWRWSQSHCYGWCCSWSAPASSSGACCSGRCWSWGRHSSPPSPQWSARPSRSGECIGVSTLREALV